MALENEIAALTAAVKENTEALKASMQVRVEALSVAKAATTESAPAVETAKPAKATKPTKEVETPKVEAAPVETTAPDPYEGLRELIADYLAVERPEERKARQGKVVALLNHAKVKKPDLPADAPPDTTNIAVESIGLFKDQMALLKQKGDQTTPESDSLV